MQNKKWDNEYFSLAYLKFEKKSYLCLYFRLAAESVDLETETVGGGDDPEEREHWGNQWEFIFSCVGLSVGIGKCIGEGELG